MPCPSAPSPAVDSGGSTFLTAGNQQNIQRAFQEGLGGLSARVATAAAGPATDEYDGYGGESVVQLAETSQANCRPLG